MDSVKYFSHFFFGHLTAVFTLLPMLAMAISGRGVLKTGGMKFLDDLAVQGKQFDSNMIKSLNAIDDIDDLRYLANLDDITKQLGKGDFYHAYMKGKQGILAELDHDGFIDFYIKSGPSTPRGGVMFNEMMEAYGSNVKGVRGNWLGGGQLADNFDSFKKMLAKGRTESQAAFSTFTGEMSRRHGFNKVRILENSKKKVVVEFFK